MISKLFLGGIVAAVTLDRPIVEETLVEERGTCAVVHRPWFSKKFLEISDAQNQSVPALEARRVKYVVGWTTEAHVFNNGYKLDLVLKEWDSFTLALRDAGGNTLAYLKQSPEGFNCQDALGNPIGQLQLARDNKSAVFVGSSGEQLAKMEFANGAWKATWRAEEPLNHALVDALVVAAENERPEESSLLGKLLKTVFYLGVVVLSVAVKLALAD